MVVLPSLPAWATHWSFCPLCHQHQSLLHVLNNCEVARDLRRYNVRHDAVLQEIVTAIQPHLPSTTLLTADVSDTYNFPLHIVSTDLRPDLVWWDDTTRSLCLAELTVCFETNFEQAASRKSAKYADLAEQAKLNGYRSTVLTIQVGSRGVPDYLSFSHLARILHMSDRKLSKLLEGVSREALLGSFTIWCSRNRMTST